MESKVLRIIDASINRAREAIRVLEDMVRFLYDDRELTEDLKKYRHDFAELSEKFSRPDRLRERDTDQDVGTEIQAKNEYVRRSANEVSAANFCRLQESLRSLEEWTKIDYPDLSPEFEQLRYRSYTLEKQCAQRQKIGD
ncbi:MAG: hypothetical protein Q4G69_00615 [Planctomycetia bacterium]|nr:hypothetical protein [Planctomycetia bacterium]